MPESQEKPEFKDKIPAAGGKVEYLYDPQRGIAAQISGTGFRAIYQVALSIDGRHLLATVPVGGIGSTSISPQPSVLAFVQSDQQGMLTCNDTADRALVSRDLRCAREIESCALGKLDRYERGSKSLCEHKAS